MKVKVCGITRKEDLSALEKSAVDVAGLILYPQSKRYAGNVLDDLFSEGAKTRIKKAAVFVNEKPETVTGLVEKYGFDYAQLHGSETPGDCEKIKMKTQVIKAFNVDASFDFGSLQAYENACDYFLFDAKGILPGGNSITFEWSLLERYRMKKPFFLSGGIGPGHVEQIKMLRHPALSGIDVNSGFEISPGVKDTKLVDEFVRKIKSEA